MKKFLAIILLALSALTLQAQNDNQRKEAQIAWTRNRIGIDCSIPDFSTKRIDASIVGDHLADMLSLLRSQYKEGAYYRRLISIMREKQDFLRTPEIKKFFITDITKKGDVITVQTKYTLTKNEEGIKTLDIPFVFNKGVSESYSVNSLFMALSKDVQELETQDK